MKKHLFLILLLCCSLAHTQVIDPPDINYVTVNPSSNQVTISWDKSTEPDIVSYIIYYVGSGGLGFEVATVPGTDSIYTFNYTAGMTLKFYVSAKNSAGDNGNASTHTIIQPSLQYDSCQNKISLSWNAYEGWSNGVKWYKIFCNDQLLTIVNSGTTYSHTNVIPQSNYNYFIVAEENILMGDTATSFAVSKYTGGTKAPDYMYATASVNNDNVDLTFTIDPTADTRYYKLQRSIAATKGYETLTEYTNFTGGTISYSDETILAGEEKFFYRIVAINQCGSEFPSDVTNNVLLSVFNEKYNNFISWEKYKPLDTGYTYSVVRVSGNIQTTLATSLTARALYDDISSLRNYQDNAGKLTGEFCYYVTTLDKSTGTDVEIRSNTVCVAPKPVLKIPNAFTPNGDGLNDVFRPLLDFIPKEYYLIIYNRWGTTIFESTDYTVGWDGKVSGSPAEPGVYIYSVRALSFDDREVYETGNAAVVYP
jgi:gliding motility-associated-like protein